MSDGNLPAKPFRMAPAQGLMVKPIENPAEQAALDERLKRGEEVMAIPPMVSACFLRLHYRLEHG